METRGRIHQEGNDVQAIEDVIMRAGNFGGTWRTGSGRYSRRELLGITAYMNAAEIPKGR